MVRQESRRKPATLLGAFGNLIVRAYAAGLLLVTLWTGYAVFDYLIETVFSPMHVPQEIREWQARLDATLLTAQPAAGLTRDAPRAPMNHYHGVQRWYQPDPLNNCTTSGCHSPLPHGKSKAVRAFANFHSTFLSCEMCHAAGLSGTVATVWVDTRTNESTDPPAMLRLLALMERSDARVEEDLDGMHVEIMSLLRASAEIAGRDSALGFLLTQFDTTEPGSPVWWKSLARLRDEVVRHVRGEYGAKLAVKGAEQEEIAALIGELVKEYQSATADEDQSALSVRIHESVAGEPAGCQACHGGRPGRLDYQSVGYTRSRSEYLQSMAIATMMQHIREGRPFHLPQVLDPRGKESNRQ